MNKNRIHFLSKGPLQMYLLYYIFKCNVIIYHDIGDYKQKITCICLVVVLWLELNFICFIIRIMLEQLLFFIVVKGSWTGTKPENLLFLTYNNCRLKKIIYSRHISFWITSVQLTAMHDAAYFVQDSNKTGSVLDGCIWTVQGKITEVVQLKNWLEYTPNVALSFTQVWLKLTV